MTSVQPTEDRFFGRHIRRWRERRSSSLGADESGSAFASPTEPSKKSRQDKFPSSEKFDYEKLATLDPQIVSLTFYKPEDETPSQLQGVVLAAVGKEADIVISDFQPHEHSFLPALIQLQICAGDTLQSINGKACRGCPIDDVVQSISRATGLVTLVLRRKPETNPHEHELCQAMFVTTSDALFPIGIDFKKEEELLMIDSIVDKDAWLSDSCLESGQVVLSMNQIPSYELDVDGANASLNVRIDSSPYVSITTLSCKKRTSSVRRAAVAVGGSAMVGLGAVVMATPLHPLGHALALGGMGVLGSEFEAPRKAVKSARRSFEGRRKAVSNSLRSSLSSLSSQHSRNGNKELTNKESNDSMDSFSSDSRQLE